MSDFERTLNDRQKEIVQKVQSFAQCATSHAKSLFREREELRTERDHFLSKAVGHSHEAQELRAERDAYLEQAGRITKHVGAETLDDAFDVLIRTNSGHMDQVQQQFDKIKEMGREARELRAERDAMREHIKNLEADRDDWRSRCERAVKDRKAVGEKAALRAEIIGELQAKDEERFPR